MGFKGKRSSTELGSEEEAKHKNQSLAVIVTNGDLMVDLMSHRERQGKDISQTEWWCSHHSREIGGRSKRERDGRRANEPRGEAV